MPAARRAKLPPLNSTLRHAVDASLQRSVDTALKATRACAQQLAPLETCLQNEMRVLERLYYKGVNQHRMALFWRRVEEVRRLGRRILEAQLVCMVDDLRYSFYVEKDAERNPKILRGAWSQVPDEKFLNFIYDRSRSLIELVATAKERFVKAYHSLLLMMQTGAFLQLILILTAIVSRLHTVMEELDTILRSFSIALCALLETLGVKKPKPKNRNVEPQPVQKRLVVAEREDITTEETLSEDLGKTIMRQAIAESTATPTEAISTFWQQTEQIMAVDQEALLEAPSLIVSMAAARSELPASKRVNPKKDSSMPRKKKKKRKDEIDDIFGSL